MKPYICLSPYSWCMPLMLVLSMKLLSRVTFRVLIVILYLSQILLKQIIKSLCVLSVLKMGSKS